MFLKDDHFDFFKSICCFTHLDKIHDTAIGRLLFESINISVVSASVIAFHFLTFLLKYFPKIINFYTSLVFAFEFSEVLIIQNLHNLGQQMEGFNDLDWLLPLLGRHCLGEDSRNLSNQPVLEDMGTGEYKM